MAQAENDRNEEQCGERGEKKSADEKPRLESEHQHLHFARPSKRNGLADWCRSRLASSITDQSFLAIGHHVHLQRSQEKIEDVLSNSGRIVDVPRFSAPLVNDDPRPFYRPPPDGDRRRDLRFDVHGRKDAGEMGRGGHAENLAVLLVTQ